MKLAVISTIRDEADIIRTFLCHLAALFDVVFLLDQRSTDGSGEVMRGACAARPSWFYHYLDFAGRHQKELHNVFMARAFERGADAVFFLDSDEFVLVASKADLQDIAAQLEESASVGIFRWRACVPQGFEEWAFDPSRSFWIAGQPERTKKVAIPRSVFRGVPGIEVSQGSHRAVCPKGSADVRRASVGHYLHVPVRSREQFLQKVFLGAISNFAKNIRMIGEGRNKRRLLTMIAEGHLSHLKLASIAAQFPYREEDVEWTSLGNLADNGFELRPLRLPFADLELPQPPQPDLHQIIARSLVEFEVENLEGGGGSLEFEGETIRFRHNPRM
jgi:hypothetical protein